MLTRPDPVVHYSTTASLTLRAYCHLHVFISLAAGQPELVYRYTSGKSLFIQTELVYCRVRIVETLFQFGFSTSPHGRTIIMLSPVISDRHPCFGSSPPKRTRGELPSCPKPRTNAVHVKSTVTLRMTALLSRFRSRVARYCWITSNTPYAGQPIQHTQYGTCAEYMILTRSESILRISARNTLNGAPSARAILWFPGCSHGFWINRPFSLSSR